MVALEKGTSEKSQSPFQAGNLLWVYRRHQLKDQNKTLDILDP